VHDILSPHARLLQFFSSHFNATRLGCPDIQRIFIRMLDLTLDAVKDCTSHPLARELRCQIVLFGLQVLRWSTIISSTAQHRLKEKILSAGLSWFRSSPKWSFGSNLVQLKTEFRLISDVLSAMKVVSFIGANTTGINSLHSKEQLLLLLLENEQSRLTVWISPLNQHHAHLTLHHNSSKAATEAALIPLVRTAWGQDPAIAIELGTRFHYPRLIREIRLLLLAMPERAISEPEALPLILDGHLPDDVNSQLKVSYLFPSLYSFA
jgi:phosphatidylinositol 4-kinase